MLKAGLEPASRLIPVMVVVAVVGWIVFVALLGLLVYYRRYTFSNLLLLGINNQY